ncbi:MAG: diacylglycerol/lipid kinase family protein [Bacteroidota bacterium]
MNNEINKVLFIVNKFSGGGFRPEVEGRIIDVCEKQDVECTIEFTQSRGHATTLAREAVDKKFKMVIAVGGDGTVNEVARGLLHTDVPMGIIPKGSGNGLARHLGIPMKVLPAIKSVFNSQVIVMDTFRMNGKLSLNVSGIGFDGHIANLFAGNKKRGLKGYTKITLKEFNQFKEFEVNILTEGQSFKRKAFVIAIANSSQYGNNARIAPAASVTDELLHVNILKKVPPYRFDFVYAFFNGTIDRTSYCEMMEVKEMEIAASQPLPFHVDGEPCGHADRFNISIQPRSLQILVPSQSTHV